MIDRRRILASTRASSLANTALAIEADPVGAHPRRGGSIVKYERSAELRRRVTGEIRAMHRNLDWH